jgi:uncharacterized protein (DUF362 family)/NAD-dependent dihydropyrimidine dehydrogenase PreA subunit
VPPLFYIDNETSISLSEKVREVVSAIGGIQKWVEPGSLVLIKPNFVAPFPDAVTSFEVLEAIIKEVKNCRGRPVIGESSGFEFDTETTFRILGAYEFAERNDVELINLDKTKFLKIKSKSNFLREYEISELVERAHVIINAPKLKRHGVTKVTGAVKNLFGLLSHETRRRIHAINLERGIFELAQIIKPDLVVVDGSVTGSRAVYGNYEELGLIVGGTDPFQIDMFCCRFLGVNYNDVGHLKIALHEGFVSENLEYLNPINGNNAEAAFPSFPIYSESLREKLHRWLYRVAYLADIPLSRLLKGQSIIPPMHYYFGMRPKIEVSKCTQCGECAAVCPVDAVKIHEKSISAELCMPVRCMKCVNACPENAIRPRGLRV